MKRNSVLKNDAKTTSISDDSTREIQIFLIEHLKLTTRRKLFEQREKIAAMEVNEQASDTETTNCVINKSINEFDFNLIRELRDFRQGNAVECMSQQNQQRLKRLKEREENFLHHHGYENRFSVPLFFKENEKIFHQSSIRNANENAKELRRKNVFDISSFRELPRTRSLKLTPENSLALSHQEFKY